ncbi:wax ester/triacylglycerol synthase family O-acyltransferase [Nocardia australiensis]|uniref:wax ester/triacylglycerol synthase family O-acyltransferase n=1 Tax=Nocardia australiensis TaxID=2887191 RepID=UPI001D15CB93|nr:wax ester/triacylglycerol synthase family O-acyltransferase [Nocardia australiensis]
MSQKVVPAAEAAGLRVTAEQLTPRDAVFVYDEFERHPSNIVAAYVFDAAAAEATPTSSEQAYAWVRDRLGYSKLFHRRLERVPGDIDLPYWVPDREFDIRDHVTVGGPQLREWSEVRRRIAEIAATRMDLSRPPWGIHIFDQVAGYPGKSAVTVVVLGFHHSVGDGVATRELELKLFGGNDFPLPEPVIDDREWSAPAAVLRAVGVLPYRCVRFGAGLVRTRSAAKTVAARVAADEIREPIAHRPATRFNRRIGSGLAFDLVTIPMRSVLDAKTGSAERITVNDLMLTVVSGALATYLAEKGETPSASLAAMVPISMRGIAQWNSVNQLCQMSVDLHTDRTDPLERLHEIRLSAQREKRRYADSAVIRRESRMQTSPAWLLRLAGWARAQRVFDDADTVPLSNTTISNVPPTGDRLEFRGAPVVNAIGVLPIMDGDGLRHLITSQGDELVISFSADAEMLPDPEHYGELLVRSFQELAAALRARRD